MKCVCACACLCAAMNIIYTKDSVVDDHDKSASNFTSMLYHRIIFTLRQRREIDMSKRNYLAHTQNKKLSTVKTNEPTNDDDARNHSSAETGVLTNTHRPNNFNQTHNCTYNHANYVQFMYFIRIKGKNISRFAGKHCRKRNIINFNGLTASFNYLLFFYSSQSENTYFPFDFSSSSFSSAVSVKFILLPLCLPYLSFNIQRTATTTTITKSTRETFFWRLNNVETFRANERRQKEERKTKNAAKG